MSLSYLLFFFSRMTRIPGVLPDKIQYGATEV